MSIQRSTSKFFAVILLLVFLVSAAPKYYLHDCFSRHTDYHCKVNRSSDVQLGSYQFNCGFVNLAIGAPFMAPQEGLPAVLRSFATTYLHNRLPNYSRPALDEARHRGPPALV